MLHQRVDVLHQPPPLPQDLEAVPQVQQLIPGQQEAASLRQEPPGLPDDELLGGEGFPGDALFEVGQRVHEEGDLALPGVVGRRVHHQQRGGAEITVDGAGPAGLPQQQTGELRGLVPPRQEPGEGKGRGQTDSGMVVYFLNCWCIGT